MIAALASRTTARVLTALAAAAVTVVWSTSACADGPTDYCRKVTAHAQADAALMFAPTVHAQLIRFPAGSPSDTTGLQTGSGLQPRAAMTVGIVDIYRGIGTLDSARADCLRQESASPLEEVIAQRADIGRAPALERKIAFLRSREAAVGEIERLAEERFAAHVSTLSELEDIRLHTLSFARGLAEAERELAVIRASGLSLPADSLVEALSTYEKRAMDLESTVTHLRNVRPWQLNVTGGVAATPGAEVFGVAELSYNFGGLFHVSAEQRGLDARAAELKNARYEMRFQIESIARQLRANADQSRLQAHMLEAELARLARDRAAIDGSDASRMPAILAMMTLQMIDVEAEQTFLVALADAQSSFGRAK
jgi:hypothetical protein